MTQLYEQTLENLSEISATSMPREELLINVSPNPSIGKFIFGLDYLKGESQIRFYDLRGKLLMIQPILSRTETVNLKKYPDGIYFYQVITNNGELLNRGKIIKNSND